MKRAAILLVLGVLLIVSCEKSELESQQVPNVSAIPCRQDVLRSSELSDKVVVEFTNKGVQITHYNFEVTCDFTTVNVTHTFVNGVLHITQQGSPNQANCVCHSDVSYTIEGISQDKVNVIFINGVQVYCHNDGKKEEGYVTFGANYHIINAPTTVTVFLDGENIGTLQNSVDAISECGEERNLTKKISVGEHIYRVEIRPAGNQTQGVIQTVKVVNGTFTVTKNECKKIFIDYYQIFGNQSNCDRDVIISKTEYENAPDRSVFIEDMKITGNCLKITYTTTICDTRVWNLVDLGSVAESLPCQRYLRFSVASRAYFECHAAMPVTKEMSFNIESLQIQGNKSVILHILDKTILYEY